MKQHRRKSKAAEAPPPSRVPVDKELWSEQSKGGVDYLLSWEYYEDKPFSCRMCNAASVFTAAQQKYTYEVKKAYVWQQHVLCASCFRARNELEAEASALLASWLEDKASLAGNASRLQRWREVLEQLPAYGVRKDTARIAMLTRALANAA